MARKKKTARSAEFKSKVALAAIQEQKTVQQLATLFDVHPTQVQVWKKQLLLGAVSLFQTGDRVQDTAAQQSREAELFEQIGRLNMELDWLKKKLPALAEARRALIEPGHEGLSIRRQCEILDLPRSTLYYQPASETPENLSLMRMLDEQYLKTPFYGSRKMAIALSAKGQVVNRKRVQRLMRIMGIEGLAPRRSTSRPAPGHRVFPYLLRNVEITHPDHVWSTDITYIPLPGGFVYLTAVMDWYSRYVLTWRLSNRLENSFCLEALDAALKEGKPEIFNTDQGAQFTSLEFTNRLLDRAVAVSMDGRGRALDNVFIERLWRSLKYEDIYLKDYGTVDELNGGLTRYFDMYNRERVHQALDYQTPYQVYHWGRETSSGRGGRLRLKRVGQETAA